MIIKLKKKKKRKLQLQQEAEKEKQLLEESSRKGIKKKRPRSKRKPTVYV